MSPQEPLMDIAKAVAAGTDVDWVSAESTTESPKDRELIRQLRVVAQLAEVHQQPQAVLPRQTPFDRLPRSWGPLEVRRELGRGSFSTVYVSWDPDLEREIAVKIVHGSDRSAAVLKEGRLLASVRHPNVVTVYGVDHFDGAVGIRMELIEGRTLKQILDQEGVRGAQEATLIGIDLCRALAAVHNAKGLHRDIKAQNVMRESTGRIVLMDFGAGALRTEEPPSTQRLTGTPLYLAPEIFDGSPATIASDIYSLGVLLYHLVTKRFPFEGDTLEAVELAHAQSPPIPLVDLRPDLPAAFTRVIQRAIEHDPARRYRSSGAMLHDLVAAFEIGVGSSPSEQSTSSESRVTSVAVLPFVNLGPDQDLEYFCNGLAEELLTALGKVPGLRVASRTSSLAVRQEQTDIRNICRQLNVGAVLEGTVRKAGAQLRINAQLVRASDGHHIWSDGYSRGMVDIFAVQEEIAQSVVERLKITFGEPRQGPLIPRYTDNPRAYELYLKGRFYWSRRYQGGLRTALEHFAKAIEEDAGYALAQAGLADAYSFLGFYMVERPRVIFARALAAAQRALSLNADVPEAHTSLALIRLGNDWNFEAAEEEFNRAIALGPNEPLPRIYLSWLRVLQGDSAAGIAEARKAQELEPLSPLVNGGAGYTLFLSRRYAEAVVECRKCLEIDPNFIMAIYVMGMCRALQSRLEEAIALMERAAAISDRAPFYLGLLANFYARAGEHAKVHALKEELERISLRRYVPPHCFAYLYAGLNDLDRAFEWEAKAFDDGASPFVYFSPVVENLQSDPRRAEQLARMGLKT